MANKTLKVSYGGNTYSINGYETIMELVQFYRQNADKTKDNKVFEAKRFLGRYLLAEYGIDLYRMGEWCTHELFEDFKSKVFNKDFSIKKTIKLYNEVQEAHLKCFIPRKKAI